MKSCRLVVFVVAVDLAVMFMGSTLLTPLYIIYRQEFGFSQLVLTLIYSVYALGNIAALFLIGRISDQIGRKRASFPALALAAICTLIFLFARSTTSLFVGRALSGLAVAVASGTATAWLADLMDDKTWASAAATAANFAGIALGPLIAGPLAEYAPAPLRTSFVVYFVVLLVTAVLVARAPETVRDARAWREVSLRLRVGVPREIRAQFVSPAVTMFAMLSLVGFYAALMPSILAQELHRPNRALGGAVVGEMFLAGVAAIFATRRVESRRAMLGALVALLPAVVLLVVAERAHSLAVLIVGSALAGLAAAVGFRGGLQVVNRLAPPERRAEVFSCYLLCGFLGNSLPVVGVGLLTQMTSAPAANFTFAVAVAVLGTIAFAMGLKFSPDSSTHREPPPNAHHVT